MKNRKKLMESGAVTIAMAVLAAASAVSGDAAAAEQETETKVNKTVAFSEGSSGAAVKETAAADDVEEEENTLFETEFSVVSSAGSSMELLADVSAVSMAEEAASVEEQLQEAEEQSEADAEEEEEKEASEWDNKLMADVEESLNVRAEASEDSEIVGKMYRGAAADVIEIGDEWTKISSGNVEGYVKNEYCLYGEEAEEFAESVCTTYATVKTDGLRIRESESTDARILSVSGKEDKLTVETSEEASEGWIAVSCSGETAYVSADYVDVSVDVQTAMTLEEEQEMIAEEEAEEAAAAAEEAAEAENSGTSSSAETSSDGGVSASADDATLLAAIIYCEAGSESYEGKLAVGAVVVNRVQSSAYPNTVSGVIYQSGQFGPVSSGKFDEVLASGAYSSCMDAAQAALAGTDNTGGALSFHAGSGSGTVIGNQTFY